MTDTPARPRPISPHLTIYRLSWTMVMSIVHRITGSALYFGTLLLAWWLVAAATGAKYFDTANAFFGSWFGQLILVTVSLVYSILYLRKPLARYDWMATEFARTGIIFGSLGLITGSIWANYTWGSPWNNDPKQIGAAIALLIYLA